MLRLSPQNKRARRRYGAAAGTNNGGTFTTTTTTTTTTTVDLPSDVIENIISFSPFKQAVRFGVLSRRFQNLWRLRRDLIFDEAFTEGRGKKDIERIVSRVLELHTGPKIDKFHLLFHPTNRVIIHFPVDDWIERLALKGIEELELGFSQSRRCYNSSSNTTTKYSSVFDIESLRVLNLCHSVFRVPPEWGKVSSLKAIVLQKGVFGGGVTSLVFNIFKHCLLLESFELSEHPNAIDVLCIFAASLKRFKKLVTRDCLSIRTLIIQAPTLCSLHHRGQLHNIKYVGEMPELNDVTFDFPPDRRNGCSDLRVRQTQTALTLASDLRVNSLIFPGLSSRRDLYFSNLKEFHLLITEYGCISPYKIISFLDRCPSAERVFLDLGKYSFADAFICDKVELENNDLEQFKAPFLFLKSVTVKRFKFQKLELEMVRFFLNRAKFLETLTLVPSGRERTMNFSQDGQPFDQILHSSRASPNAKIVVLL